MGSGSDCFHRRRPADAASQPATMSNHLIVAFGYETKKLAVDVPVSYEQAYSQIAKAFGLEMNSFVLKFEVRLLMMSFAPRSANEQKIHLVTGRRWRHM
jgi:hypothetical protein